VGDGEKGEAGDQKVTIRERDSMEQIRVPLADLDGVFTRLLGEGTWGEVAAAYPPAEG
jgi:glycyl-tRNA synthetase (class II)